jgi:hypothetical protein
MEASTKLHLKKPFAASRYTSTHDLFSEPRGLTRRSIERGDPEAAITSTIPGRVALTG